MGLTIPLSTNGNGHGDEPPVDWDAVHAAIFARLDFREEYQKLGVTLKGGGVSANGFVECYAVGRGPDDPDTSASACFHARKGFYLDSGLGGKAIPFFRFALEHGQSFGSYKDVYRHYAEKTDVKVGRVTPYSRGGHIETFHVYCDAEGVPKYRVGRAIQPTGKKTFPQWRWDGDRWVAGVEGVTRLPYRLPDLLARYSSHDYIVITEGEKDVDRAYRCGFVATCNSEGAGKWTAKDAETEARVDFNHLLPAHDYVVIPDNDEAGRKHAEEVAASLKGHFGTESVVKVVPLPGVPKAGDLSDWMDLGGTAEELRALIEAAPAWEPGQQVEAPATEVAPSELMEFSDADREATIVTLEDVADHVSDAVWVWDGWISAEALTLVAAEPGIGKTLLMMDLHRRVLLGKDGGMTWPDGSEILLPPGGRTLWIPADNHYKQLLKVADSFGIPRHRVAVNATKKSEPLDGRTLMTAEDLANLERNIRLVCPYWVVIDTITQTGEYKSQDTVDAKRQYTPLQEMALRTGVPIICVTHLNAGRTVIGRRAVEKCRTVVMLSRPDRDDQPHRRKLWVDKTWDVEPPPLGVTVGEAGYSYDSNPPEEPEKEGSFRISGPKVAKKDAAVERILECLGMGAVRSSEVKADSIRQGFTPGTYLRAKEIAVEQGLVREYVSDGRDVMELAMRLKVCP